MCIGRLIADGRYSRGWTQRDLGEHLGIGASLIAKWEQGIRVPAPEWRGELEQVLDITFDIDDLPSKPRRGPKPSVSRRRPLHDTIPDNAVVLVELGPAGVRVFHGDRELETVVIDVAAVTSAPADERVQQISELLFRSLDLPRPLADRVVRRLAELT